MKLWRTLKIGSGGRTGCDMKAPSSLTSSNQTVDTYELDGHTSSSMRDSSEVAMTPTLKEVDSIRLPIILLMVIQEGLNAAVVMIDSDLSQSARVSPDSGLAHERFARRILVHLAKPRGKELGLILAGRSEPGLLPTIAGFKKESAAAEADRLAPGDRVCSINGINTARLSNDEVLALLANVEERASLEVEYYLPNYDSQNSLCITTKVAQVSVEKSEGSLGVTLRAGGPGGGCEGSGAGPLHVTHVRPAGPAHATARIKPGDRLLKVDNISLTNKTLAEAYQILQNSPTVTNLMIEYDISIMESVKFATGPLLIEIERANNENLGLFLTDKSCYSDECFNGSGNYQQGDEPSGIYIDSIVPASISDRCGALHQGDQILAVDDLSIESSSYTPEEVMCYMENCCRKGFTQLQILPVHMLLKNYRIAKTRAMQTGGSPISGMSTLNSKKSHRQNRQLRQSSIPKTCDMDPDYCHSNFVTGIGVCRSEVLSLQLEIPPNQDSGITVCEDRELLLISHITHQFPAYRCGCLQLGDRIISLNSQQNLTAVVANDILQKRNDTMAMKYLNIKAEFSMADSVEASSGVFNVKLAKFGAGLGVTITGSKLRGINHEEPMMISHIKVGSVAYRSGTLAVGDHLIAIDSQPLHNLSLDAAFNILQNFPDDIIMLTVRKTDKSNDWLNTQNQKANLPNFSYGMMEASQSGNSSLKSASPFAQVGQMKNQQNTFDNMSCNMAGNAGDEMQMNDMEPIFDLELIKQNDGPLGLTIAGSEDASQPIILSGLVKGGFAERSGMLQIGDRILSINHESVHQKPLSEAIKMLQTSSNRVILKVYREGNNASAKICVPVQIEHKESYDCRDSSTFTNNSQSSPGVASIDSAVESWDSQPAGNTAARDGALEGIDESTDQNTVNLYATSSNDNRLSYLPTDENKLLASGYRITEPTPSDSNELQMPNYSFTNTLRTFKSDKIITPFQLEPNNFNKTNFNDRFKVEQNYEGARGLDMTNSNNKEGFSDRGPQMFNKPDSTGGSCKSESSSQFNPSHPQTRSPSFKKCHDNTSDTGSNRSNTGFNTVENSQERSFGGPRNMLSLANYQLPMTSGYLMSNQNYEPDYPGLYNMEAITNQGTIHHVTLYKDVIYDDYGFSVSDGLYERGVYINRIRKGGPADIVGLLRPYDRILQVNGTRTVDFDCCLTVPLIASAGDRIELVLQRLKDSNCWSEDNNSNIMETSSVITKTI